MVLQRLPQQGLQQRVCLCSVLPYQPLRTQVRIRVICPPGWPPARAAILGGWPPAKASPRSQAQRASPHLCATCFVLSLQWLVPQTCATLHTGQARRLHGMCHVLECHRAIGRASLGTGCGCQAAGWAQTPPAAGAAHHSHGKNLIRRAIQC